MSMLIEMTHVETHQVPVSKIKIPTYCCIKNVMHGLAPVQKNDPRLVQSGCGLARSRTRTWTGSRSVY